ncbi:MAG: hypothetical protein ABJ239_01075 [Erythrobacter sp.]
MLLFIILAVVCGPALIFKLIGRDVNTGGAIGMGLAFLMFGVGHFLATEQMTMLFPDWVPLKREIVLVTGVMELVAGAALFLSKYRKAAGWAAIAMLIGFLPANIYGALERVPFGGHEDGMAYLAIRIPLQAFLIWWAWRFAARGHLAAR